MKDSLKDKIIVVTGGAGLIGREFCTTIAEQGGIPIIADLSPERIKLENTIRSNNYKADNFNLNITSKESILECIDYLHKKYGKIDAVVNNAYPRNKNYGKHFFDVEFSDFCENMDLNLGGYFLVSQLFSKYFIQQNHGNIVNISSIYGVTAPKFEVYNDTNMTMPVEYAVIKSGLLHLTKYMAKYLAGNNIRVNAISLGGIKDSQPEAFLNKYKSNCLNKGMLDPSDISGTLLFLLSDNSLFINGQNIIVDDGFTL